MAVQWLGNPEVWTESYEDQNTISFEEYGFGKINEIKVVSANPPKELRELEGKIEEFWKQFEKENPRYTNGNFYCIAGVDQLDVDKGTLIIPAFKGNYATLMLKLSELKPQQKNEGYLNQEEWTVLKTKFHLLGVAGYLSSDNTYLCGRAKNRIKDGLWEYVPQGCVEFETETNKINNICAKQIKKELQEETGLDFNLDIIDPVITHINISDDYANFSPIWNLTLKPKSKGKIRCSNEHTEIAWKTKKDILNSDYTTVTPVTYLLFEKISGQK